MNQLNNKILVLSKAACNIQAQEDHILIKYIYRTEQKKWLRSNYINHKK